jgi:formate hydrogenlyase transcriptional activator
MAFNRVLRVPAPRVRLLSWLLASTAIAVALCHAVAPLVAQQRARAPLVFVGNDDFAPLSYLDNGKPRGLDVEMAMAVGAAMGREVRIELMNWGAARDRVLEGRADALIDLSSGDERSELWEVTESIIDHEFGLFVRASEVTIRGVEDLEGRVVGAAPGGLAGEFLMARGGITVVGFSDYAEGLGMLQSGMIDAIAAEKGVLAYMLQRRGITDIAAAGDPFVERKAGFGVRKGNTALVNELNEAITRLLADGTIGRIQARWKPTEFVVVPRERVERGEQYELWFNLGALVLIASLGLWVVTLKRHIRVQRAAEGAVQESRERLGLALSSAEMGTWRWTESTRSGIRDANLNAMLGLDAVETAVTWEEWFARVHPDDRAATEEEHARVLRERTTFSSEFRIVRTDGAIRWWHGQGKPVYDDQGELVCLTGVVVDVTDRKLAEDAQRASEEKFHKAFNSSPDCIAIYDLESEQFIDVNERFEQITGFPQGDLLGRNVLQLGMVVEASERDALLAKLQGTGSLRDFEIKLRRKDGAVLTALVSAEVMVLGGRRFAVYVARDVTRHRQLESQLKRASEINRLFVSELDPEALYAAITQSLGGVLPLDYAGLALYDGATKDFRVRAQTFYDGRGIAASRQAVAAGSVLAAAALERGDLAVFEAADLESFGEPVAPLLAEGLRAICCVPLGGRRGPLGALMVGGRRGAACSPDEIEVLRQLATYVGIAIENAQTYEEVTKLKNQLTQEKLYLEEEIQVDHNFRDIVGGSQMLRRVLQDIETVAPTESTVLITGETGTGKGLLARAIHELSQRKDRTFVRINVAALPATLIESELFGYERGAFTGALTSKVGRFELAHRGTLFLDEIGDLPLELQAKLLRALQEREFERLGGTRTQHVDVRVVAATNRDLEAMVREGTFRSDLFYRLNVFPIRVPSLRERPEDIPPLVRHFVQRFSAKLKRHIDTIPASTMSALQRWHWPGNIRELENVIERAVIVSTGSVLQVALTDMTPPVEAPAAAKLTTFSTLADAERDTILRALREANGVIAGEAGAAARLGMKRTTLQSKMRKLGIRRPTF